MTEQKWVQWVDTKYSEGELSPHIETIKDTGFSKISMSEFLKDNFLSMSESTKRTIANQLLYGTSPLAVGAVFELRNDLQKSYPAIDWLNSTAEELIVFVHRETGGFSREFTELYKSFIEFQGTYAKNTVRPFTKFNFLVPLMYHLLYGEETVCKILKAWMDNTVTAYLHEFIEYANRWSEFEDYPVDWALTIVSNFSCEHIENEPMPKL